ncbi:MAG TPA: MbnP family protein [Ohtaekwangia sp.]
MKNIISVFMYALVFVLVISCSEDDNKEFGSLELEFDNVVGEADLELNTSDEPYTNEAGETYAITSLRYYISNIKLKRNDGTVYEDEMSADGSKGYYLIDEAEGETQHIELEGIPAGDYTEITFTIGVDANQVTEGAQTGPLDPAKGMFWSWKSGYVFVAVEGTSSSSSDDDNIILYHVGGYDTPNNIKTKTLPMGSAAAQVRGDKTPEVHVIADVNKFFASPHEISFEELPVRHMPADNVTIAENYVNAFVVDHVHN